MKLRHYIFALSFALSIFLPASSCYAAPGNLPKSPLLVGASVEPNVYFTFDNSGSMDWEMLYQSDEEDRGGFTNTEALPIIEDILRGYWVPDWVEDGGPWIVPPAGYTNDSVTWDEKLWVLRNHNGNRLYYNPSITYKPWAGVDESGNALYTDASPTSVLRRPDLPNGDQVDLTKKMTYPEPACLCLLDVFIPVYYTWQDDDEDGVFETTDKHKLYEIKPSTKIYPSGRSYKDELQNFANWFQYYRKREFTAKAGVGSVISNSDAVRMGLYIYNGGHKKYLSSMSDSTNKRDLLTTLYPITTKNRTPSRIALQNVGNYFMQSETANGVAPPILDSQHGGECQQNFNILMSDGYWNLGAASDPTVGNADSSAANDQGFDGDKGESIDGGNYEDGVSDTLADVAMYYYENDLRPDLANKVSKTSIDKASHQHLVTYTLAFGLKGTLPLDAVPTDPGFAWPETLTGAAEDLTDPQRVDDMWHAAYNGRGQYFSANNPEEFLSALNDSLQDISSRTETSSAVAVNSARLTTDSVVYISQFNSNNWQGSLAAYPIVDTKLGTLARTPKWRAETELDARDLSEHPRQIITYNGSQGVPFQWDTEKLSEDMQNDLRTNRKGSTDVELYGRLRLKYLRGEQTYESKAFRVRDSLLGDIVNSGPVFVGKAGLRWPDVAPFPSGTGSKYSDFKNSTESREKVVYVGANDGFLHAFKESNGQEILAYAPNILSSSASQQGYHYITEEAYQHNWYVDMTPTISDIYFNNSWHTVMVGGLRGGGRGLFALDITNPSRFKEANADKIVMWEFTNKDAPNLGYTYSRPVIALANNGRWVAIFGSGYNDSGDGKAKLFIVDIEKGMDGWDDGDYIEISTGAGTSSKRNGLASPALVDTDGNGTVDRIYAGDLEGNMWAFDVSSDSTSRWKVAFGSTTTPQPLFKTESGQAITAKPIITKHPTMPLDVDSNAPNLMVYFGTGQYLVNGDKTSTGTQSFYGVWDKGANSDSGSSPLTRAALVEQTVSTKGGVRLISRNAVDYSEDLGWWFDLPDSGERSVTNAVARRDVVFFNTFVPTNDPCSTGGYGWKFVVDMATGGSPLDAVTDYNKDGVVDETDLVDDGGPSVKQDGFLSEPVFVEEISFTGDKPTKVVPLPYLPSGRFSWQELIR